MGVYRERFPEEVQLIWALKTGWGLDLQREGFSGGELVGVGKGGQARGGHVGGSKAAGA